MFRVPKQLLVADTASAYYTEESLSYHTKGDHLILSFHSEEEGCEWTEEEAWLASLVPLRSDLMNGDHRCLYLGWLHAVQEGELGGFAEGLADRHLDSLGLWPGYHE